MRIAAECGAVGLNPAVVAANLRTAAAVKQTYQGTLAEFQAYMRERVGELLAAQWHAAQRGDQRALQLVWDRLFGPAAVSTVKASAEGPGLEGRDRG